MSTLDKQYKSLSSRLNALTPHPQARRKVSSVGPAIRYKSGRLPWLKPVASPYASKTTAGRLAAIGASKPPTIIEKPVYLGERGPKGERGVPGIGKNGRDGRDGETPVKGKDYFTQEEVDMLKQEVSASIKFPEPVKLPEPLNVDQEFVKRIIQIMHSLPENDKLEVSKGIRNAQSFIYKGTKYQTSELMHGGGSSGSSGTVYYTPTGTVNSSNTVFGVTAQPTSVIMDGGTYFENNGYTYTANVITMNFGPSSYIRYTL